MRCSNFFIDFFELSCKIVVILEKALSASMYMYVLSSSPTHMHKFLCLFLIWLFQDYFNEGDLFFKEFYWFLDFQCSFSSENFLFASNIVGIL